MPKKVSERQKKEIVDGFINGKTIDTLSEEYSCTKITITRHLKNSLNEDVYKKLIKENKNKNKEILDIERELQPNNPLYNEICNDQYNDEPKFLEIAPLNCEINMDTQKDLSSIPISEINLPKMVYLIIDNRIELETKLLLDYPAWQFLSQNELNRKTIEIYFDLKIAKKSCNKDQKVIKVPNSNVFRIVAPILISRGISRIVCPDNLIAL